MLVFGIILLTIDKGGQFSARSASYPITKTYKSDVSSLTLYPGEYLLQCWGSAGGNGIRNGMTTHNGGSGAYAKGKLLIKEPMTIKIVIGNKKAYPNGGFRGNDTGAWYDGTDRDRAGNGGGSTYITTNTGIKLIEAGGGSGATALTNGNPGGPIGIVVCSHLTNTQTEYPDTKFLSGGRGGNGGNNKDYPGSGGGGGYRSGYSMRRGCYDQVTCYQATACSGSSYANPDFLKDISSTKGSNPSDGYASITTNYVINKNIPGCIEFGSYDSCNKCGESYILQYENNKGLCIKIPKTYSIQNRFTKKRPYFSRKL